ncbi:hypothetical protein NL108_013505 [Boleophthalmus pectinirostris]|nr:hypothetical protein NL108_013505 [Boleophthalmus pectinirostris]
MATGHSFVTCKILIFLILIYLKVSLCHSWHHKPQDCSCISFRVIPSLIQRMRGPIVFLTLALVIMSMTEPAEAWLNHLLNGVHGFAHGLLGKADDQQNMQEVLVEKRSPDDYQAPDNTK